MVKSIVRLLAPVVALLAFSALTLAGLTTLDVNVVPLKPSNDPARLKPSNEPKCWKVVPESDEKGQSPRDRRRPPRAKSYLLVREGQGRVVPCDQDESQRDKDTDVK